MGVFSCGAIWIRTTVIDSLSNSTLPTPCIRCAALLRSWLPSGQAANARHMVPIMMQALRRIEFTAISHLATLAFSVAGYRPYGLKSGLSQGGCHAGFEDRGGCPQSRPGAI